MYITSLSFLSIHTSPALPQPALPRPALSRLMTLLKYFTKSMKYTSSPQYFINFMINEVLVLSIVLHQYFSCRIHWIREVLNFESLLKSLLKSLIEYITVLHLKPVLSLFFYFSSYQPKESFSYSFNVILLSFYLPFCSLTPLSCNLVNHKGILDKAATPTG